MVKSVTWKRHRLVPMPGLIHIHRIVRSSGEMRVIRDLEQASASHFASA